MGCAFKLGLQSDFQAGASELFLCCVKYESISLAQLLQYMYAILMTTY